MANQFGHSFRITTFGESHGGGVGVVIDGCPPGIAINMEQVQAWLDRRRPGQSHLTSPRAEDDTVECLSGLHNGISLGTPMTLLVRNKDYKPDDYQNIQKGFRPSHADFTTQAKYGVRAPSGGGRSSARETIGRVAAAAVAEQFLQQKIAGFSVVAYVETVKDLSANIEDPQEVTRTDVDKTPLRCPDQKMVKSMEALIMDAKKSGDTVGGVIFCGISGCPLGLGEPVFDKLEADLAKAMMSLPASKGFEVGSGFAGTKMYGSEHNDAFEMRDRRVRTLTNHSGGIQGGISNGEFIYMRVAFKPVSTIFKDQKSVSDKGDPIMLNPNSGRHDPCVLPRAVPMVEAMAMLVIADHYLRQLSIAAGAGDQRV